MKTITTYECEVCGLRDQDRALVETCEAVPMARLDFQPGDVVTAGHSYGWWNSTMAAWFHEQAGDPNHRSHLVRGQKGWPLYIVLAIIPYRVASPGAYGAYAHRELAILYSPQHANHVPGNKHLCADVPLRKIRQATPEELEQLTLEAIALDPNSREARTLLAMRKE